MTSNERTRLAVVFVQYDRRKYPLALLRLLGTCDRLAADTVVTVVDNGVPGDWAHSVSDSLHHIGGDNTHWEFSAFEKGLDWLEREGYRADVYALATDALLAYGEEFLELVDDVVVDASRRFSACVGWIDSFLERCEILGYRYEAWLRTSLVFLPASVLPAIRPLALELDESEIFGPVPERPFRAAAPLSQNLKRLLLEWLTTGESDGDRQLDQVWHSRFRIEAGTFDLFKGKVKSILREHVLSARLKAHRVPCYDLRAIRQAAERDVLELALAEPAATSWQWLGWRRMLDDDAETPGASGAEIEPAADRGEGARPGPTFVLAGVEGRRDAT